MPLAYWLCVISVLFWLYIVSAVAKRKDDFLHPVVVFAGLFSITYPLKLLLSFHGFHTLDSMSIDQATILSSIAIFNLAGLFFIMPMTFQSRVATGQHIFRIVSFPFPVTLALVLLMLIVSHGINAFLAIFSLEALQGRIAERANERVGSGLVALLGYASLCLLIIFSIKYLRDNRSPLFGFIVVIGYSAFALVISGSKYEGLLLPVIFFIVWYYQNRSINRRVLSINRMFFIGMAGVFFIALFGYIRGMNKFGVDHPVFLQAFYQLIYAFDAPDNLIIMLDRAETWIFGELNFRPLFDYLILPFIPRFVWAEKPLIQGNQLIMQEYFPERFGGHLGEVISPSLPGEMILAGGLIYMMVWLFILGFLCGRLYTLAQTKGGFYFIAYIWVLLNMFNFLRSGTGAVGSLIMFTVIGLITYYSLKVLHIATLKYPYSKVSDLAKS